MDRPEDRRRDLGHPVQGSPLGRPAEHLQKLVQADHPGPGGGVEPLPGQHPLAWAAYRAGFVTEHVEPDAPSRTFGIAEGPTESSPGASTSDHPGAA